MTFTTIKGDPETVSTSLQAIIDLGNDIKLLKLTKNNAEYLVYYVTGDTSNDILLEDGFFLLLEDGSKLLLE